jgi:4-amino-4-deoxy-L-arabinose transferase-like glycosyltransferase
MALVLVGATAFRLRVLSVPLERDEGGYAYMGQRMLVGEPPFASGHSLHMPGTPVMYAAAVGVFGPTVEGVRLGLLLVHLATIALAFLLARRLYGLVGGAAGALAYATLSTFPEMLALFGHANQFVTLFAVGGLLAFVVAIQDGSRRWIAAAGLLLGIAPVMKQSGAVFPAFALTWLGLAGWRAGKGPARRTAGDMAILGAFATVPTLVTVAWLAGAGVLDEAWVWMFEYARSYTSMQSATAGVAVLGTRMAAIGVPAAGILALALVGLLLPDAGSAAGGAERGRGFLALLLGFAFLGIAPGLYFRHHYFVTMVPVVALAFGRATAIGFRRSRPTAMLVGAFAAGAVALAVFLHRDLLFEASPVAISRELYGANPFPESLEVARYIRERSREGDRIAVLGSEPQIPFYAGRQSATRYLYLYPLLEPSPFGPAMKAEMMAEVEAARPAWLVWVNQPASWDTRVGAARPVLEWADRFLALGYVLDGRVAIRGPRQTDYAWGEEARRLGPGGASVLVYRRVAP